ncbi:cilia- and flagella-associated protein 90 [Engraulis encrasicolus]|uniref:cilia- and flagella-associated protein 90 n=1 Tax=Engraulis encrasicolus TaxID=184585 RepID=UPI002FD4C2B7
MDLLSQADKKPLSTLSVFSFIPSRRSEQKELTYYNFDNPRAKDVPQYDLYRHTEGYDNKLHRDDRQHAKGRGLDFSNEEASRSFPVLSSSEYGRRFPLSPNYHPGRRFFRVNYVRSEFFTKNGITKSVEEGYGSVVPV